MEAETVLSQEVIQKIGSILCWFVDILVKKSRYILALEVILQVAHFLTRKRVTGNSNAFIIEYQLTSEHRPQQKCNHPRELKQVSVGY